MQDTRIYILHGKRERQERETKVITRARTIVSGVDMNMLEEPDVRCVMMADVVIEMMQERVSG